MKASTKSNPRLSKLIFDLKTQSREQKVALWRDVAERFERPSRHYAAVNLSKINRFTTENEIVLVPGKVLGTGLLDHAVTVAALNFSVAAEQLITGANGKCLTIEQLMQTEPAGKGVRIIR